MKHNWTRQRYLFVYHNSNDWSRINNSNVHLQVLRFLAACWVPKVLEKLSSSKWNYCKNELRIQKWWSSNATCWLTDCLPHQLNCIANVKIVQLLCIVYKFNARVATLLKPYLAARLIQNVPKLRSLTKWNYKRSEKLTTMVVQFVVLVFNLFNLLKQIWEKTYVYNGSWFCWCVCILQYVCV